MASGARRVIVLGSTGSIGVQTLRVIAHLNALHERGHFPFPMKVVGLAAGRQGDLLAQQRAEWGGPPVAIAQGDAPFTGPDAALQMVRQVECDLVVAAMVGFVGLAPTMEAVSLGRDVALANKETLVAAGSLVCAAARRSGSRLLPIDSEHAALWQCLQLDGGGTPRIPPCRPPGSLRRAVLTASGGPFRDRTLAEVRDASPDEALRHPTWKMGPKVTIDSATLVNKALELVEAHWLFGLPSAALGVLLHPQSLVHALAEYADGTVIAQAAATDMCGPIQQALAFPHRVAPCGSPLDWASLRTLEFREPDPLRFPAIGLAARVIDLGGTAGAVLNAANEEAVGAFLSGRLPFGRIVEVVHEVVQRGSHAPVESPEDVVRADADARRLTREVIGA